MSLKFVKEELKFQLSSLQDKFESFKIQHLRVKKGPKGLVSVSLKGRVGLREVYLSEEDYCVDSLRSKFIQRLKLNLRSFKRQRRRVFRPRYYAS